MVNGADESTWSGTGGSGCVVMRSLGRGSGRCRGASSAVFVAIEAKCRRDLLGRKANQQCPDDDHDRTRSASSSSSIPSGILTPSACCSRRRSSTIRRACSGRTMAPKQSLRWLQLDPAPELDRALERILPGRREVMRRRVLVLLLALGTALGGVAASACYDNDGGTQQDGGGGGGGGGDY
jgi:hypothetical protein